MIFIHNSYQCKLNGLFYVPIREMAFCRELFANFREMFTKFRES
jgi:hypothetical protein